MGTKGLRVVWLMVGLAAAITLDVPAAAQADQWSKELAVFEEQDRKAPALGGVVFVGSSTIRLWDLPRYFPKLPAINRGFGGSQIRIQ